MHQRRNPLLPLAQNYDIRDIDEDLYLAVLACRLSRNASPEGDLGGAAPLA